MCANPIPCSTFRNTATPLPVFKFRIGGREYTMTEEEYIVKVGSPSQLTLSVVARCIRL